MNFLYTSYVLLLISSTSDIVTSSTEDTFLHDTLYLVDRDPD